MDIQHNDPTTPTRVVVAPLSGVVSVTTTDTRVLFVDVVVTVLLVVVSIGLLIALSLMHHHSVHERLRTETFA